MKQIIIFIATLMGVACYAPTSTCYGQPGETGFERLEVFGPPGRSQQAPAPANPLVDSLVAYYGLEEASGTRYDGHGTNHLTAYNNPGDTVGVIGRAATFDNVIGQYLGTTAGEMSVMQGDWSLMFWAKVHNPSSAIVKTLLQRGTQIACPTVEYLFVAQNGSIIQRVCDLSIHQMSKPIDTSWYLYTITFDRSADSLYLYIGGVLSQKEYISGPISINSPFSIGATGSGAYPLYGYIDEVYYWRGYCLHPLFINWYYNGNNGRSYQAVLQY